jgi:hypothetical protein
MRLDQYLAIQPYIQNSLKKSSISIIPFCPRRLPTAATASSAGFCQSILPNVSPNTGNSAEMDNSRNRNEHQLLDEHIVELAIN